MPAAAVPAIAVDQLVKVYKTTRAVDGISFALEQGSITGLLGGNGAGKTTTIAMILGLVMPTSGTVRVLGAEMPRQRYQVLHRMNFESPYVDMPHRLTVRQNLKVFGRLYAVEDLAGRIATLAQELDLAEFLDRPAGKLSAGQKTRVALAKALINAPEVLLLDEPTASLDPDTADWVRARLERFRRERGATVLLASHNMAEVERLCERVIIMKRGRIEDDDTPQRLLARYGRETLEEVFLDVARGRGEARARPRNERASASAMTFSPHRVGAMVLRYLYLLRSSWTRLLELIYWPAVQLFVWGFLQFYIAQNSGFFARAGGVFIGAVMMWDILFRGQLGFSISFLEEMWSRNLEQPDDQPAAADRVRLRADDHEHHAARDRHGAGDAPRDRVLRLQRLRPGPRARGVLPQPDPDQLGGRHRRVGRAAAQRHGRGERSPGR